jgi:crotonobetainyl-CoA:carnitine CoA-transferase CaiB-like acyl-CoA transferase
MIDDPKFRDNTARLQNRDEVDAAIGGWVATQTRDEVIKAFADADVTSAPVYDISDLVEDPHVVERGVFEELPDDEMGWVQMHAPVPRFSEKPAGYSRPAPSVGQHTAEVLQEFGFDETRIADLRGAGIIEP